MDSYDADLTFLTNILPEGYETVIRDFEPNGYPNAFTCILRLPISNKEDALKWLKKFEEKSRTGWRVDKTYKELTSKIIFKKSYHCDHNSRPRNSSTITRDRHTSCLSKLSITINQTMKRSRDPHNTSHPCQISLRFTHNHDLTPKSKKRQLAEDDQDELKNIASCQEQLNLIFEDMSRKLSENPSVYTQPLSKFISFYKVCETDSALVSALCNFGKNDEEVCTENDKTLERQRKIPAKSETSSQRKSKIRKSIDDELKNKNDLSEQNSKLESILKKYRPIQKKLSTTQPFLIKLKSS